MGENYLRQQAGNFRKRSDLALAEADAPMLFERPEILVTLYTVEPNAGEAIEVGEQLYVVLDLDQPRLPVCRNHEKIAHLGISSEAALRQALDAEYGSGVVPIRVVEVAPVSGVGKAAIGTEVAND